MNEKFSLGDLMKLELHNYVEICAEIVDRAQKELIVEKVGLHPCISSWVSQGYWALVLVRSLVHRRRPLHS